MADFVGSVNLVRAAVVSTDGDRVRVRVGERELDLPRCDGAVPEGRDVLLSIRPESLRLATSDEPVAHEGVAFAGVVVRHTFLGHLMRYAVRSGDSLATITICQDRAGTQESSRRAAEWVGQNRLGASAVSAGDLEWLVDQPDPGASAPLDGAVTVLVNPERIHLIRAADSG